MTHTRRRDSQVDWASMFFFVACLFWAMAQTNEYQMAEPVYGHLVSAVPAWLWASALMFTNAAHLFGLYINGRWKWSPAVRVLALTTHTAFSITFLVSSLTAPFGDVVTLFSAGFAVWNVRYLAINVGDLVRVCRG